MKLDLHSSINNFSDRTSTMTVKRDRRLRLPVAFGAIIAAVLLRAGKFHLIHLPLVTALSRRRSAQPRRTHSNKNKKRRKKKRKGKKTVTRALTSEPPVLIYVKSKSSFFLFIDAFQIIACKRARRYYSLI